MSQIISIMLGGALGSVVRFFLSTQITILVGRGFPYGTLLVNVLGSFLMGFLSIYWSNKMAIDPAIKSGVLVGFLGALTTFSTFSLDTLQLIQNEHYLKALSNSIISVTVCVLAVFAGMLLARS